MKHTYFLQYTRIAIIFQRTIQGNPANPHHKIQPSDVG